MSQSKCDQLPAVVNLKRLSYWWICFLTGLVATIYLVSESHYSIATFLCAYIALVGLFMAVSGRWSKKAKLLFGTVLIWLLLLEVGFRLVLFSTLSSHSELNSEQLVREYVSAYQQVEETHLYEGMPNWDYCFSRKEFEHCRKYNEFGIPHDLPILPGKPNVLFLGDSFTEGHGTPQGATYVNEMERLFKYQLNCINAGMGGSDPFYEWKFYKEKLRRPLHPNAIVMTISTNDIMDVMRRGGDERFDSTARVHRPPSWEPLFASSYLVRFILFKAGYDWFLNSRRQQGHLLAKAVWKTREKIFEIYRECEERSIAFFVVLHPEAAQCKEKRYSIGDFLSVVADLPPEFVVDAMPQLANSERCDEYYWEYDRHFNTKGYYELASIVYHKIHDPLRDSFLKLGE